MMASSCSDSEGSATTLGTSGDGGAAEGGNSGGGGSGSTMARGGGSSGLKKGPWTSAEDAILMEYVKRHGEGNWNAVQRNSGLLRCGKSCRLRWANHLRPNLKKGSFSPEEERLILELHARLGNKWARMAAQMPGRTDNEIKNYWNTRMKRRQRAGLPIYPPGIQRQAAAAAAAAAANNAATVHQLRPSAPTPALPPPDSSKTHQFRRHASRTLPPSPFAPVVNFHKYSSSNNNNISSSMPCSTAPAAFLQPRMPDTVEAARIMRLSEEGGGTPDMSLLFFTNPIRLLSSSSPHRSTPTTSMLGYQTRNTLHLQHQLPQPQHQQHFSMKMELPSNQMFPPPADAGAGVEHWVHTNGSLLEALLGDAQQVDADDGVPQQPQAVRFDTNRPENGLLPEPSTADVAVSHWGNANTDSGTAGGSAGQTSSEAIHVWGSNDAEATESKMKAEQMGGGMHSGEDDLSALLNIVPPAPMLTSVPSRFPEWCDGDTRETSSGGRADFLGSMDAEIGLEMHQATSSLSTDVDEDTWNSRSTCHWTNMSGIC